MGGVGILPPPDRINSPRYGNWYTSFCIRVFMGKTTLRNGILPWGTIFSTYIFDEEEESGNYFFFVSWGCISPLERLATSPPFSTVFAIWGDSAPLTAYRICIFSFCGSRKNIYPNFLFSRKTTIFFGPAAEEYAFLRYGWAIIYFVPQAF